MNIILCPGSAKTQKFRSWDSQNFIDLSKKFISLNHHVSILLGPKELYLSDEFNDFDIIRAPSFRELKEISLISDLIICNDSFLQHYFCFLNNKVLTLYGPTDPNRTLPPNAFKISSKIPSDTMPCWGTKNYGKCDNGRCSCFDNLFVEDVLTESLKILNK